MQVIQETYELQPTTNASNPRNLWATTYIHNPCEYKELDKLAKWIYHKYVNADGKI